MNQSSRDARNGALCALAVAAAMWASYPVAEMGFMDDWSYIKSAQIFAQTGHFVYNGWATAMLGWQIVWGALFIKLFGFSFTVTRLSMLPVVMATAVLLHSILRRFGVTPRNAVFGTLTFGFSPLFLPLAASFMSDVPGVFVVLLCLYCCKRAVDAETDRATIAWLVAAAASNALGGSVRQIAWLGALVMLPCTGWLLRKRRGALTASLLLWAVSAGTIFLTMRWFARQPYSVPEPLIDPIGPHPGLSLIHLGLQIMGSVLLLLLLTYPILVAWLPRLRLLSSMTLLKIGLVAVAWICVERVSGLTAPWLIDLIGAEFATKKAVTVSPVTLLSLPAWGCEVISSLFVITGLVFVHQLFNKLAPYLRSGRRRGDALPAPWQEILWILGPFTACNLLLLVPRGYRMVIFDRYFLTVMPIFILCLLLLHQQWIGKSVSSISIAVLAFFTLLTIAGTHDWFAWHRAVERAANEIRATGVPRTKIEGGFEYDGWTQIEAGGYINDPRLVVPAGAFHPVHNAPTDVAHCGYDFAPYVPAIHPKYSMLFADKMSCLAPSKFPTVTYRTWLPPFHGTVPVQMITTAGN